MSATRPAPEEASGGSRFRPRAGKHSHEGHELGVLSGLAALSLDALSSVAYGPEAIVLVLVLAGTGALHDVVADHARDHGDAGAAGDLLLAGDRGALRGRRGVLGRQGESRPLAEPAGGRGGRRRLRADGRGQPRGRRGQPRQRVPLARAPPARGRADRSCAADVRQHVRDRRVRAAADRADAGLHREHHRGDRGRRFPIASGRGRSARPSGFP